MTSDARTRRRLERLAYVLDDSIRVPFFNRRIGLDSVIGLVPVVGDIAGGALSASIVIGALRMGVSWPTIMRMLANVAIEIAVGVVPLLGDLFDMGWKANRRNVTLMQAHLDSSETLHRTSRARVFAAGTFVIVILTALTALIGWIAFVAGRALLGLVP